MINYYDKLLQKIKEKKAKIGIIGLGYVGLPLAILFEKKGFAVTGLVRNEKRKEAFKKMLRSIEVTTSKALTKQDIIIICVPTPVDKNKNPDLTILEDVASKLSKVKLDGKLLINESTVAPFTTREILGGFPDNYFLVASPERIDPGNRQKTTEYIPKVIGAVDKKSLELGVALYRTIMKAQIIPVTSIEAAEMTKMLENTYRNVNIALVNEFAKLAEKCQIDILEVINATKTKWSFQAHYPGIGVGGHCIPVDPYYILDLAKKRGLKLSVVKTALKENEEMPKFVAEKVKKHYREGMKVLIYGLTYKKDVSDLRESPVLALCDILTEEGITFSVYDPLVSREMIEGMGLTVGKLALVDIFVVGTNHKSLLKDAAKAITKDTIVIDGRNFFKKKRGKAIYGIGRSL